MERNNYENYEILAAAIVGKACEDYCNAKKGLMYDRNIQRNKATIKEVTEFFNSKWFKQISPVLSKDPKALIKSLNRITKQQADSRVIRFLGNA